MAVVIKDSPDNRFLATIHYPKLVILSLEMPKSFTPPRGLVKFFDGSYLAIGVIFNSPDASTMLEQGFDMPAPAVQSVMSPFVAKALTESYNRYEKSRPSRVRSRTDWLLRTG